MIKWKWKTFWYWMETNKKVKNENQIERLIKIEKNEQHMCMIAAVVVGWGGFHPRSSSPFDCIASMFNNLITFKFN